MDDGVHFHGDGRQPPGDRHPESPRQPEPYVAAPGLVRAVNLAIYLRRPLLLEGEAGCGKTRLASAVAHELGAPLYTWPVRSTSKAQEGLYSYDYVLRLHDVQTSQIETKADLAPATGSDRPVRLRDPREPRDYRTLGALGRAFTLRDRPAVVLIDEIDKADLDFPNDLLTVLDEPWSFTIPETGETVAAAAGCRPIVIITSNKEKGNLPAPFLRRCIYYYVEFPEGPGPEGTDRLKQIVAAHYQRRGVAPAAKLVEAAAGRFLDVRRKGDLHKKPGTSEFLDWLEALRAFEGAPVKVAQLVEPKESLPYPELLFKLRADWQRYRAAP
jgi:MoxR-like ATPase